MFSSNDNLYERYEPNRYLAICCLLFFFVLTICHYSLRRRIGHSFGCAMYQGGLRKSHLPSPPQVESNSISVEIGAFTARLISMENPDDEVSYIIQRALMLLAPLWYTAAIYDFFNGLMYGSGYSNLSLSYHVRQTAYLVISCHNIVITSLPTNEYGTNNAVNVLTNLTRTFESIYLSLMVGIGGGVPRPNFDIRLGDIIVGTRVVQHDLGKIVGSGQIQHTAVPRTLAHLLGKALSLLQAEHQPHSKRIPFILEEKFRDHPGYAHPSTADRLFSSEYPHNSQASTCDECSPSALVQRNERSTRNPYIHYGTIASGNQVMKSSTVRDTVAHAVDAICFEMEAAGLSDICPCLSIRGICDYCDSHKSKKWQEYAAATAAAFAREFLEKLPPTEESLASTPDRVREQEYWLQNEKYNSCLRDLRETDPRDDKTRIEETKGGLLKDAYRWILENDKFQEWYNASCSQLLWIKGDPGKGKTMLLCGLINELEKDHRSFLSYFFCQATEARLSNATAVLRGIIYLLVVQRPPLFSYIEEKYDHAGKQLFEDGNAWQALSKIFMAMLEDPILDDALLIVDALDECSTDQEKLLDLIVRSSTVKWIVTSRNWPEIEQWLDSSTQKVRLHLELNQDSVSKAVEAYIEFKVGQLAKIKQYDAKLKSEVKSHLVENADGSQYEDEFDELPEIIGGCGSFLTLRGDAVYFLHQSAKEFLLNKASEHILPSGLASQHEIIFERSLQALSETLRRDICQLNHPGFDIDDISPDVLKPLDPIRYSCIYWVDHLNDSEPTSLSNHLDNDSDVHVFIQKNYLYWLEALGLLRSIVEGVKAIYKLEDLATALKVTEPVAKLLEDARRFILTHKRPIEIAPLQVYVSGLVFSPEGSLIRERFKHEEPDWISLKPKMDRNWSKCLQTLEGHGPGDISVALSPDNQLIASGGRDKTVRVWDITTGLCQHTLEDHDGEINSITFLPDGQNLAAASGTIKIWNIKTESCLRTLVGHSAPVRSVASSPDGFYLGSGSSDRTIKIWCSQTGKCLKTLEGHPENLKSSVAFSPDSQHLASASIDNTVRIWDMKTFLCLQTLQGHDGRVTSVAFSSDGRRLASISADGTTKVWDATTGSYPPVLEISSPFGTTVAFSADGKRLAFGDNLSEIKLFDAETGEILQTLRDIGDPVTSVAFTADSQRLVSGSENGSVKIWVVSIDVYTLTVEDHEGSVNSIAISADGLRVMSGCSDTTVKIWDAETGTCLQTLEGHHGMIDRVACSPDNKVSASGSVDGTIKVWDTITWKCLHTLEHDDEVTSVAFSEDGQYLASGSKGNTAKIWDAATGRCLSTLEHDDEVTSVAFSADSRYLAAGLDDMTTRIWNIGEHSFKTLQGHTEPASLAFSVDTQYLASGSWDRTVSIWDLEQCMYLHAIDVGKTLYGISFDLWTNSQLYTDIGILDITVPNPTPNVYAESIGIANLPSFDWSSHRINIGGEWITKHGENVLWLPSEYRPWVSAVFKSTIALGCDSGRVLIMSFC
ncbi:unnamed protein product [Fusarium equiseti]|uniref:Mitochondrial division protein 1 n=1 Tax=Fusarium equiseti TaxID=61235 RepID=A0A8J2NCK6_FUSEQ|nr:unnamed protein product [Fusarium equiseti]